MNQFEKIKGHLSTINEHKAKVMELCFQCGLYKQGLFHDLSKYSPLELKTGFKYFQGYRSPIDAQKEAEGYSFSWLHHKGHNPHHWEFWIDNGPNGPHPIPMEFPYVVEMFCDRVAAGMTYRKDQFRQDDPYKYYMDHRKGIMIHPKTDRQIRYLLSYMKEYGLEKTIKKIRTLLKEYRLSKDVSI